MTPVQIENLRRVFDGGVVALENIALSVAAGEFVAILGPSGCGKSTLLRIVAGLDRPTSGVVRVGDANHRPQIAYVFQDAHLLPWRNVRRNVELPLELMGIPKSTRRDAAMAALETVGLSDVHRRYPNQLSGGMRMRVSIARALIAEPKILLLDEPFAALDEITRQKLDEQLRHLWQSRQMTVLFVTHSTTEAVFLADRAIVLSARPGKIIHDRKIDLPADRPWELRASPEFAAQTHSIFQSLQLAEV